MIKFEKTEVTGLIPAIRGMRNPMNSWDKSDSEFCGVIDHEHCPICKDNHTGRCYRDFVIGDNDLDLMLRLAAGGPVHAKYRRMITVYVDITAPLYWWKEFDTYKVGTVANSCSTMHKIHAKEFTLDDFSCEHLIDNSFDRQWITSAKIEGEDGEHHKVFASPLDILKFTIEVLNGCRSDYLESGNKRDWWQMIQLLPSSYNQKRTVMLNYEVLVGIYKHRRNHKLEEWQEFCRWIEELPYSEIITFGENATTGYERR